MGQRFFAGLAADNGIVISEGRTGSPLFVAVSGNRHMVPDGHFTPD